MTLVLTLALFGLWAVPTASATNVSGTISSNTTWTLANSPYVMTGDVTVAAGVTLTVQAGVRVEGNAPTRTLFVNGSLVASGTSAAHVTFTSTTDSAPGQWRGIIFGATAGASTLSYVDVRHGGGAGISDANGMVQAAGGALTLEDSTFTESSVSGIEIGGGTSGTAASATIRRSKLADNGFVGTAKHGDGLKSINARVVVEDSAFWSNAQDGLDFTVTTGYTPAPSNVSGSSMWGNTRYGIYISQDSGAEARGPDGSGNEIYGNGTFGFSSTETWVQLWAQRASLQMDWTGNYWGPVTYQPCLLPGGQGNGHLSYLAPDPNPYTTIPIDRGPVERDCPESSFLDSLGVG